MKVGIVDCGFVGATAGFALVMQGVGREVVLVEELRPRGRGAGELASDVGSCSLRSKT